MPGFAPIASKQYVIVDCETVPARQTDSRCLRRYVAERRFCLIDRTKDGPGDWLAVHIEHVHDRIDWRAESSPEQFDDKRLSLVGSKAIEIDIPVMTNMTRNAARKAKVLRM